MTVFTKSTLALALAGSLTAGGLVGIVRAACSDQPVISSNSSQSFDEDFPKMHKALRDLRAARDSLTDAEPIFQGRRDAAIKHTDEAIDEVEAGLKEH
jgi:hypothetical protein